jgi:hypothetical protein
MSDSESFPSPTGFIWRTAGQGFYNQLNDVGRGSRMDMVDNEVGRSIGKLYTGESERSLCQWILTEASSLGMKIPVGADPYLYKNGHLIWRTIHEIEYTPSIAVGPSGAQCTI